ncbi:glycosyltransferase involved in cell wall biosynthesis [Natronocella acetinitrilica]|uniref:Glycosyltransferase involved in cell wall biosynthesis n=2 Tax=Natronocella acetinitrilica TaxID=414046 RepID=A0AAE3KCG5_9GAMM|nr:glycosyltransferase involved in cell wall biosynthesis [Natronocella acetinitrilica]
MRSVKRPRRGSIWMLSTDPDAAGGVATVIRAYRQEGLDQRWPLVFLATHVDGSWLSKLKRFLGSLIRFTWGLLRGRVALVHAHAASRRSFYRKSVFVLLARMFRVPAILHMHGGEFDRFFWHETGPLRRAYIHAILRGCHRVLVLSEHWRRFYSELLPPDRIQILPNGVNVPMGSAGSPHLPPAVLFMGRLEAAKGVFDLLQAFARLRSRGVDAELWLAGVGDDAGIRRLASDLGVVDDVRLLGWIDEVARLERLRRAWLFCLPSRAEGLPIALLEAMVTGLPAVVTRVGAMPEVIIDGEQGLTVESGDIDGLEQALGRLLGDPALRECMGRSARDRVRRHFDIRNTLDALERLYGEIGVTRSPSKEQGACIRQDSTHPSG